MRKPFTLALVLCLFFQSSFVPVAHARTKLLLGLALTAGGVTAIIVGTEEHDVLTNEYDFTTEAYVGVWDPLTSTWVTEWYGYQLDPDPATIVEEGNVVTGYEYGTNGYIIFAGATTNHHKVYETEKRMGTLGKVGLVATGVGVTLVLDYLLEKTKFTQKTGLELRTVTKPDYCGLALARRY